MPDVDSTLHTIAPWRYMIKTDLTRAFYQIPLSKSSLKYCGVATPFRGIRVYTRSAMGMPGSETALEEMMCRVLGDFIEEGFVAKLADDLYCGADSPEALLHTYNWQCVLQALDRCNLPQRPSFVPRPPPSLAGYGPKAGYQRTRIVSQPWHLVLFLQL